jgi:hypothetical protein
MIQTNRFERAMSGMASGYCPHSEIYQGTSGHPLHTGTDKAQGCKLSCDVDHLWAACGLWNR